jgi:hypothetical protein
MNIFYLLFCIGMLIFILFGKFWLNKVESLEYDNRNKNTNIHIYLGISFIGFIITIIGFIGIMLE